MKMNNIELAEAYLEEAYRRIRVAEWALNEKAYAYCIRQVKKLLSSPLKLH